MKVITDSTGFALKGAVVSIGMFDGVHRGHAKVLRQLRERGEQLGLPTAVVTFDPHPRAVVRPDACPRLLSTLDDRMQLLAATGAVDHCLVLRFDRARSQQPADEFVFTTLLQQLGMRALIVGENFACGRGRQGTVDYLSGLGQRLGFAVTGVPLDVVPGTGEAVRSSSTEARRLIQSGDLAGASELLQRPHEMTGTITRALARVAARHRGRTGQRHVRTGGGRLCRRGAPRWRCLHALRGFPPCCACATTA